MNNNSGTLRINKRALSNKPLPPAKRTRLTKSARFSNLLTSVRTINKEGRSAPVVRDSTTRKVLNKVHVRSNQEQKKALNVSRLVGEVSSRNHS